MNRVKRQVTLAAGCMILSGSLATQVYAGQAYVNDKPINTITKDERIYVPLAEISTLLGANVEYDPEKNIAYVTQNTTVTADGKKSFTPQPIVKHSELYPVSVNTYDTEYGKEIVKIYELVEGQNPANIPREDFEENGYTYKLAGITKESLVSTDTKETTETLTLQTASKDINQIMKEIPQEKEFTTADGYTGVLKLDANSIQTDVAGYKSYSYTLSEKREYPNLTSTDTSQIPKTIQKNGKTLSLTNVQWRSANTENIDYLDVANVYTAVATYSADATGKSATGYNTIAKYTGMVSKVHNNGTVYTARFTGTVVSVARAEELLKEAKTHERLMAQARKAGMTVEELIASGKAKAGSLSLGILTAIGALLGILLAALLILLAFGKNVTVYAPDSNGEYEKIGKLKLKKKKPIINLGNFNDVVTTPSFLLVLDKFTAWRMRDKTITIHRGDSTYQHIVKPEKGQKYQFDVKF